MPNEANDSKLALNGGKPSCDFTWPDWPVHDEREEAALLEVLRSGKWWYGRRVRQFEDEFACFQGARYAVSCTNGTTALEMGLRALGVVENDEVIVPAYSFVATATAVVTIGAIPVFADILPDTLCLDPNDVQRKVTSRTSAIVPVHVAGRIADMESINSIAKANALRVLEDAAHAWGSQLDNRGAGTLGQAGTFSFQETKNMTAGEGGILVTDDQQLADLARSYTHCGRTKQSQWYDHNVLGSNLRLTEFQAAVLSVQLGRLQSQLETRDRNAQIIDQAVRSLPTLRSLAAAPKMTRRSHHMVVFLVNEPHLSRDRVIEALNAEGIPAVAGWYRPLYENRVFQDAHQGPAHGITSPMANKGVDYRGVHCPVCEQVCDHSIWIPQHVLLGSRQQTEKLCDGLQKVLEHLTREALSDVSRQSHA